MDVRARSRDLGRRVLGVLGGWSLPDVYSLWSRSASWCIPSGAITYVEDGGYRRTVAVSTVGVLLFVVLAPTLLPLWGLKSLGGTILAHVTALKLNMDVLACLALASDYLKDAQAQLDTERKSIEAERDAFVEFADEVQAISTVNQPTNGGTTAHVLNTGTGRSQLEQVRDIYQETVMSIPDYDQEYDEQFTEHIAAEFGTDVATVVVDGHRFTEPVKQLLVEEARQAAQRRQELLDSIGIERRSLRTAESDLAPAREVLESVDGTDFRECNVPALVESDSELRESRNRCESALRTRQKEIHAENKRITRSGAFLQTYLYRNLEFSFPVLRTALEYIDRIDERRAVLVQTLYRRP